MLHFLAIRMKKGKSFLTIDKATIMDFFLGDPVGNVYV